MTCGHCRSALTEAISGVGGVLSVEAGRVAVTTSGEPDDAELAKVVDDAGYELTGRVA
ncbi:heavy-metal-associated domain-containing protein [Streptomyces sp. NBC_01618]|uniref:heavy-metal-associated domain-containing protein n=1 Tax=Streptomyces sp. NBC_01618 TaxID=2975900 RepID=UPI00386D2A36